MTPSRLLDSFAVGDVAGTPTVPGVTVIASGSERVLIGLRARHYTAWSDGAPVDGFHLYVASDGQISAWKADAMCPRRHAIREAAAEVLNRRPNIGGAP